MKTYLFTSERLGFRNWEESDIAPFHELNSDRAVMEFFPKLPSLAESKAFVERMKGMYEERGYCYFAVDLLKTQKFIGFIGIAYQDYAADFTPCVDIGWRLAKLAWGKGYATEGAKACLEVAFEKFGLEEVYSLAPAVNLRSTAVMEKIGMEKQEYFNHPKLEDYPSLKKCVLYRKVNSSL
ncbi:GNAT family N-acetyltransferase [Flammeovirgaceae bacterium SG7u.111]|nr:GNAT family N-acetyltransferase [Flammeovirgaceae bacterium SG7u.132]WPO36066.1 GNAT family N-acetyltransferase [Flammeovirgaceae bacterium SG7u.111]